ncbi:MAG: asparagine synthase (glutamine-hydrolyzing) [Bacteroidetes bacterium]|nr:MAG: asparagine synthase (glutamine-hydrolyzing) [Bacteroidota bacterium]
MCGIAGIIGNAPQPQQTLRRMLDAQQHRGPDAAVQKHWAGKAALGHNRLSIIDLQESANQPMASASGRYTIVFNGEIYNYIELRGELPQYHFVTQSDTEVLLAAVETWGIERTLPKLNGMFSFGIYDAHEDTFWAARDRFGVKPFYYHTNGGVLWFASEPTTLFAAGIPKLPNNAVWASYFAHGHYGQPHQTFWQGIDQLPAGTLLKWQKGNLVMRPWYSFQETVEQLQQQPNSHWEEEYRSLLKEAVELRFRADVPVGFNLSGGLDSSTLLALVNASFPGNSAIEAFTFTTGDERYDELPWVQQMLQRTANPLNVCQLNVEDVPALAAQMSRHQMEPFGGFPTLAYSNLFKTARQKGVLVLLDGQGMDEAWAGYDYYTNNSGSVVQGVVGSPVFAEVLDGDFLRLAQQEQLPQPFDNRLQNLQFRDLFYTKIPRALRFNDRVSMMHSTELREPFLDYRLVTLAFSQPEALKIRDGQRKWMLRNIAREMLGDTLALAPKRALQTPQREWLAGPLADWAAAHIEKFSQMNWVDGKQVMAAWQRYRTGSADNSFYIWQWINAALIFNSNE